jgi:FKBP-type peptidyl-prolyl cis-trans isomerase
VYSKDSDPKIFKYHYTYLKEDIEDYAYLFNYQKEGKKATYGDFVWINYTQKSLTGSIIDSSDPSVAVGAGVSPYYTLGGPILMQMNTDAEKYIDPLSDILMNIPEGTTGSSIVSSIMSLSSALVYRDYTVESIVEEDNLLDYEKSMIGRYFADNNLDVFKEVPLHEGKTDTVALIAKTKENASGVFVQATDSVTVWAEGRILDELNPSLRQFLKMDSDDVVTWYLPDMIKGISLTLPELKVGEEATILFSSGMGYGYRGSRNYDGTYVVPAYSTLLFKVKIVDTKENPKKDK